MIGAVFLDRDGTINREVDYLTDIKQLRLLPGAAKAIGELNKLGMPVIIVTNQAAIANGRLDEAGIERIHNGLKKRLAIYGAKIDAIYYCPHHPDAKRAKYKADCQCRKPNIGMLTQAAKDFKIDLQRSFLIGDRTVDILAGNRAKTKTILVKTGYGGQDKLHYTYPDAVAANLYEAVDLVHRWLKS